MNGSRRETILDGEAVPVEGRIAAICDAYDALISERPCKKAWPTDAAIDCVVGECGGAFEPRLVTLFVEQIPEILMTGERYSDSLERSSVLQTSSGQAAT